MAQPRQREYTRPGRDAQELGTGLLDRYRREYQAQEHCGVRIMHGRRCLIRVHNHFLWHVAPELASKMDANRKINMSLEDKLILRRFFTALYESSIDDFNPREFYGPLAINAQVLRLAHMWRIQFLEQLALEKYSRLLLGGLEWLDCYDLTQSLWTLATVPAASVHRIVDLLFEVLFRDGKIREFSLPENEGAALELEQILPELVARGFITVTATIVLSDGSIRSIDFV